MVEVEVFPPLVGPALPAPVSPIPDLLFALMQPSFYYSFFGLIALSVGFLIVGRSNSLRRDMKSIMYVLPLIVPLITYAIFRPSVTKAFLEGALTLIDGGSLVIVPKIVELVNPVGVIMTAGLIIGGGYLVVVLLFGGCICKKAMSVVEIGPEDYPRVWEIVRKVAARAGLRAPRVGIVEEIEPKAFMVGGLGEATLVFSIGLIEVLNEDEIEAVAAHEIAHLKNRDHFFEAAVNALKMVSFFNPFAYLMASKALKEREMLADEFGSKLIDCPAMLGKALIKVWEGIRDISLRGALLGYASGLFVVSPLRRGVELFSSHPPLSLRVRNIIEEKAKDRRGTAGESVKEGEGGKKRNDKNKEQGSALVLVAIVCVSACFALNVIHNDLLPSLIFGFRSFPLPHMHQSMLLVLQPNVVEHYVGSLLPTLTRQNAYFAIGSESAAKIMPTSISGFGSSMRVGLTRSTAEGKIFLVFHGTPIHPTKF